MTEQLDLAEGKRLLSEAPPVPHGPNGPEYLQQMRVYNDWLEVLGAWTRNNADALLSLAERAQHHEPPYLAEGKRLLSEATPGPWLRFGKGAMAYVWKEAYRDHCGVLHGPKPIGEQGYSPADAALVIWLRNNADSLIAAAEEAEKLRAVADAATAQLQAWDAAEIAAVKAAQDRGIATARGSDSPTRAALRAALQDLTQPEPTSAARPSGDG